MGQKDQRDSEELFVAVDGADGDGSTLLGKNRSKVESGACDVAARVTQPVTSLSRQAPHASHGVLSAAAAVDVKLRFKPGLRPRYVTATMSSYDSPLFAEFPELSKYSSVQCFRSGRQYSNLS